MKKPTKKDFYEHISKKFNTTYKDPNGYMELLDVIQQATADDSIFMELAELTLMNKADRLIYRYAMACQGREMTPYQVDISLAIIEYGLEYVV